MAANEAAAEALVQDLRRDGLSPDGYTYGALIRGARANGDYARAKQLLEEAKAAGLKLPVDVYNVVLSAFARAFLVDEVEALIGEMAEDGVAPTEITFRSLVAAQTTQEGVEKALAATDAAGIARTSGVYAEALRVLGRDAAMWDSCMALFKKLQAEGPQPDYNAWMSVIKAADAHRPKDEVHDLVRAMKQAGLRPPAEMLKEARRPPMYTPPVPLAEHNPPRRGPREQQSIARPEGGRWSPLDDHSKWSKVELPPELLARFMKPRDEEGKQEPRDEEEKQDSNTSESDSAQPADEGQDEPTVSSRS
ncbi:hypothetical protein JKP88DRAFT_227513 [Tribonema minus]|uniref:Pentatricopeptide repeat-containing protein n=1 Tax=Tribonema minus TaxID=303371 RepID=A0A835YKA3_9STRA|nr:hypothetical protein JKP88DRAFT_227513 [Tribonema minus]